MILKRKKLILQIIHLEVFVEFTVSYDVWYNIGGIMNELKKKLYKCFEIIDTHFFDDFETNMNKRIAFQKYGLFFAFFFGLKVGDFSLYLHGPYNSELTDVGYEFARNKNEYSSAVTSMPFADVAISIINLFSEKLSITNTDLLEVYATYFYLLNKRNDISEHDAQKQLSMIKKNLMGENPKEYIQQIVAIHSAIKDGISTINPALKFS